MAKAIIFDCFGVLATEAWLPFKAKYFGHDPALLERATNLGWQADRGVITYRDFIESIAELSGLTFAGTVDAIARNTPNEQLFRYISELKNDYKLGILSNVAGNYLVEIFTPEQLALFDIITLSYETGFIKPEREAFTLAAEQLGVTVAECVFVDDQERNVKGAKAAGMRAIRYDDVKSFRQQLPGLLKN